VEQFSHNLFKWTHEADHFVISDIDPNFFACRYLGSEWGFVIDKVVFAKHLAKGKIQSYSHRNLAV
jgi:hypothetical protein